MRLPLRVNRDPSPGARGYTRRRFIGTLGAAGAALSAPALLSGCGSDDNASEPPPRHEHRTLFFNFAHLGSAPTTHYLYVGGRKHALTAVADQPEVLRKARSGNEFLRSVPDDRITHHVEVVPFAMDVVTLAYLTCNESPDTGTWQMTQMFFNIPSQSVAHGYAHARAQVPAGDLPLSKKRKAYGVRPAASAKDLLDEHALIDSFSHAQALVGLHPDILSIEANSAAIVHGSYLGMDENTETLGEFLHGLGPAVPQGAPGTPGKAPWAVLVPLMDPSTSPPRPFKMTDGKLNQYQPDWTPDVDSYAALAIIGVQPLVRNDEALGVDFTGITQANPLAPSRAHGKLWGRHDGATSVQHTDAVAASDAPAFTFTHQGAETGLKVWDPANLVKLGDGRVQVTLDGVQNWFLRFLGMWIQFVKANGLPINTSSLPADTLPSEGGRTSALDKEHALFVGVLPPPATLWGIPVSAGAFAPVVKIPSDASTMRIFYGGLGQSGSIPDDPPGIIGVGVGMTAAVNYGIVGLFMAGGVSTYDLFFKGLVNIGLQVLAADIVQVIGSVILDGGSLSLKTIVLNAMRLFFQGAATPLIGKMIALIAAAMVEANWIDSVPLAGQIARALAGVVGAVQLAETSIEVALSPAVYRFDLTLTHDLPVKVLPGADGFPPQAPGYAYYYKVTYLFDEGSAHVLDSVPLDPQAASIDVLLKGIPRGGKVNIKIGIYARAADVPEGQNDWCAGYASTGPIDNTLDHTQPITITRTKIPIQATTRYLHTRKTTLDAASRHRWLDSAVAPPFVRPGRGQTPSLGDFRSITVRQATLQPPQAGYVGYSWQAYSSGISGCGSTAPGQFDQMANLNTDALDQGVHAQDGYFSGACGLPSGVTVSYDLLDQPGLNFYLDTQTGHVRQVQLGNPPGFAGSGSDQSFGKFNLSSSRVMMHPSGHLFSISTAHHKLERLDLANAPMSDADASSKLIARTFSGLGTRPGLMTSPVAAAISPDGAILVLEGSGSNRRIQAFDVGGNPMPYFKQQARPYFLPLTATAGNEYLDLAVEFTGYLYVLSKDASENHRLDIYHPGQSGTQPICTTQGINAAKLAVDLWRSVYTLNYEMLRLPDGSPPNFTEPSVSLWVPPPPT